MATFSGLWKLDKDNSNTFQTKLLEGMGRPWWQSKVIGYANEDFRLLHFKILNKREQIVHCFDKNVHIYVLSDIIPTFLKSFLTITAVKYKHLITANGVEVKHPDDEKQFGDCTSSTTWDNSKNEFTIEWNLQNGLLTVVHSITPEGNLNVNMKFIKHTTKELYEGNKVYKKVSWNPDDIKYINDHTYKEFLQ